MAFVVRRPEASPFPEPATRFLGFLYAEDFDAEPAAPSSIEDPAPAPAPPPPPIDLDVVRAEAVEEASRRWKAGVEERRVALLSEVSAALADAQAQAAQVAAETAAATASALMAALMGMFPKLCEAHGEREARAVLDQLLPLLKTEPKVVIRVHPSLVAELRKELLDQPPDLTAAVTVLPAQLQVGDVEVSWEKGSLTRDTKQMLQAMQNILTELHLMPNQEQSAKRTLAYAD